jgi:hypothetical protein
LVGEQLFKTGWYFDVAGNVLPWLGVVFQVGGNSDSFSESETFSDPGFPPFVPPFSFTQSSSSEYSLNQYMGGVRFRGGGRVTPFGQFLVGQVKTSSQETFSITSSPPDPDFDLTDSFSEETSDFAIQFGGGVDIRIAGGFGVRAGGDYIKVFPEADEFGETEGGDIFRWAIGGVYSF